MVSFFLQSLVLDFLKFLGSLEVEVELDVRLETGLETGLTKSELSVKSFKNLSCRGFPTGGFFFIFFFI